MRPNRRRSSELRTQMLDVQLLDVFAEVESLLRSGREIQHDALQLRIAAPTDRIERRGAARRIEKRVAELHKECRTLCAVVETLARMTIQLRAAVDNRRHRRREDGQQPRRGTATASDNS